MEHPPRNVDMTCFNWVKLILRTDMPSNAKYLALYLATFMNLQSDMAFPSLKRIEGETGLAHATVIKWLGYLENEGWLVKQSGSRTASNRYWNNVPDGVGQRLTYVNQREEVGQPLTSNNNRITRTTTTTGRMPRPELETIKTYCREKGYTFDPEHFFNYYESNGWKVGKNPMKSWMSACATWQKKEKGNGSTRGNTLAHDLTDRGWAEK